MVYKSMLERIQAKRGPRFDTRWLNAGISVGAFGSLLVLARFLTLAPEWVGWTGFALLALGVLVPVYVVPKVTAIFARAKDKAQP